MNTYLTVTLYFTLIVRIFLGPLPFTVVVAYHYLLRIFVVSLCFMLTFNRILTSVFVLNHHWIGSVPEKQVMICFGVFTFTCTLAGIIQEAIIRDRRGLDHFGRWYLFIWMGKVLSRKMYKNNIYVL